MCLKCLSRDTESFRIHSLEASSSPIFQKNIPRPTSVVRNNRYGSLMRRSELLKILTKIWCGEFFLTCLWSRKFSASCICFWCGLRKIFQRKFFFYPGKNPQMRKKNEASTHDWGRTYERWECKRKRGTIRSPVLGPPVWHLLWWMIFHLWKQSSSPLRAGAFCLRPFIFYIPEMNRFKFQYFLIETSLP